MKLSIVIAVLNSHEVVRRQVLHFEKMNLSDDIEIIFVDDGSDPPIPNYDLKNFKIYYTNDTRPWTQPIARNLGVKLAQGEYVTCTDIDHILCKSLIDASRNCATDVLRFRREAGILNEDGMFTQNIEILKSYGLLPERIAKKGTRLRPHSNSYTIRRDLFLKLGGSREDRIMFYPNRDETPLKAKLKSLEKRGKITINQANDRPIIYMFPNGKYCGDPNYNPFGLFHDLKRAEYVEKPTGNH